jgi:hypothetical protein
MGLETPAMSAIVARLSEPNINLAAWGGVVFPLALIIESPIIMLLAASTALSKDWDSYVKIRRYMMWASGILTALHILVAFTPLYDLVVVRLIDPPIEIIEPGRIGLRLMLPWTWSIAYRRFNQGVLIRFGHSEAVGIGTVIRLCADGFVLGYGLVRGDLPGIVVATLAITCGVVSEAIYAGLRVRPVIRDELKVAPRVEESLTIRSFSSFYVPLALTSLLTLLTLPIGSAALSRMPMALESLAVWPVVGGLIFMLRSLGVAYNEVTVALLDEPLALKSLRRFAWYLVAGTTILLFLVAGTELSTLWLGRVSALVPPLVEISRKALWFALLLPGLNALLSWFQGLILHSRRTRGITEAVVVSLCTTGLVLTLGVMWGRTTGLYVGWTAFSLGALAQSIWLWWRSRPAVNALMLKDKAWTAA